MKENLKRFNLPIEVEIPGMGIKLQQLTVADTDELFALIDRNREHLSQFHDDTAKKYRNKMNLERSFTHPKNPDRIRFGIWNIEGDLVGTINLTPDVTYTDKAEVGYYLGEEYTKQGYMRKALATLLHFAFRHLDYSQVYAKIHVDNKRSEHTITACGFKYSYNLGDYMRYTLDRNDKGGNF